VGALDKPLKDQLKNCLVIGGCGFLGRNIGAKLFESSCDVKLLGLSPKNKANPHINYYQGDILHLDDLLKACQGVDTVFHTASVIVPFRFLRRNLREKVYNVNVVGTQNVIKACIECGVSRLIYTSTNNVVFDHDIKNGDESLPYAAQIIDIYTETKMLAEKEVLAANGRSGLLTCAIRPGGIYGPGDKLILNRIVHALKQGYLLFTIGNGKALSDSVYIDNLVHAHLLAAIKLEKNSPVAGQAYFVSDGEPFNYFSFVTQIIQGMGHKPPPFSIPYVLAYVYSFAAEGIYWLFNKPRPFLTIMEVKKIGYSNYFSSEKAKRDFGYEPLITQKEGIEKSIPYCLELFDNIPTVERPALFWWISVLGGMTLLGLIAFQKDAGAIWTQHIPFIDLLVLKVIFILAVLTHLSEAIYAYKLAKQARLSETALGWSAQTFLLGYPSLKLLLKRIKRGIPILQ